MSDYVRLLSQEDQDQITVVFEVEHDRVMALGERLNGIREDAYMNGYNWEVLVAYYASNESPNVVSEMETDSEAGTAVFYYPNNSSNRSRAESLKTCIVHLVEHPEYTVKLVEEYGDEIEWD